jgi:hypothetical protein
MTEQAIFLVGAHRQAFASSGIEQASGSKAPTHQGLKPAKLKGIARQRWDWSWPAWRSGGSVLG